MLFVQRAHMHTYTLMQARKTWCTATATRFTNVLRPSNPGPTLWVINRAGRVAVEKGGGQGGGPGSVCFLQGPEGELQSSPSWPLHHLSDTDRLQHPHSLSPPRQHLSSPRLAFPRLSIHPNLIIFCSLSALLLLSSFLLVLCFLFVAALLVSCPVSREC